MHNLDPATQHAVCAHLMAPVEVTSERQNVILWVTDKGVSSTTFNARIVALRFFFGMTCGREEMKRFMQFRTNGTKPSTQDQAAA